MVKRIMMCMMCFMVLSACDSGTPSSPINDDPNSYLPIDLETVTETASGMVMTGAIDHNTGEVLSFSIPVDYGQAAFRNLEVETRNGYLLRFVHRTGIPSGTYPITTVVGSPPIDSEVAGGLLYLWSPNDAEQFTVNPQGSITLDFQDDDVLGRYNLTVENPAGAVVNITGQLFAQESTSVLR